MKILESESNELGDILSSHKTNILRQLLKSVVAIYAFTMASIFSAGIVERIREYQAKGLFLQGFYVDKNDIVTFIEFAVMIVLFAVYGLALVMSSYYSLAKYPRIDIHTKGI